MIDFSKYKYAVVRIYECTDDKGFPTVIFKPISLFESKKTAIEETEHQMEYERKIIMSNPTCKLSNVLEANNIMVIEVLQH